MDSKIKILVVDDDDDVRELIVVTLLHANFEVQSVNAGVKVAGKLLTFEPDWILMDLCMPLMDGIQTINYILNSYSHRSASKKRMKIIVITGYLDENSENYLLKHNIPSFTKPINFSALIELLKKY